MIGQSPCCCCSGTRRRAARTAAPLDRRRPRTSSGFALLTLFYFILFRVGLVNDDTFGFSFFFLLFLISNRLEKPKQTNRKEEM
jgi:hypothetical protein